MIVPDRFNLADAICKRHADAVARVALIDVKPAGSNTYTYGGLDFMSDKFATALAGCGIIEGDAVAVITPQSAALVIAHLGALKTGAAVVPLPVGLDRTTIEFALKDSNAKAVVADYSIRSEIAELIGNRPLFIAGDSREANEINHSAKSFWREVIEASSDFAAVETLSTSPAFIFYTNGAQGDPHNHSSIAERFDDFEVKDKSVLWPAANYCSVEVLLGRIYPALWHGYAVASHS
ncbi:MAG: class I adenylate-forming enzyme family protein [Blastocatellia bacterium]